MSGLCADPSGGDGRWATVSFPGAAGGAAGKRQRDGLVRLAFRRFGVPWPALVTIGRGRNQIRRAGLRLWIRLELAVQQLQFRQFGQHAVSPGLAATLDGGDIPPTAIPVCCTFRLIFGPSKFRKIPRGRAARRERTRRRAPTGCQGPGLEWRRLGRRQPRTRQPRLGAAGNEPISGVAWRMAVLEIRSLQLSDPVLVHGREFGAQSSL